MQVINARNVNDALVKGVELIQNHAEPIPSRVGDTLEVPEPVATVYHNPWERVLLNSVRDANPFFHLMESLWIIAGREDTGFLCEFNKRMVDYSDDGKTFNAPYGHRMRHTFGKDQINGVIEELQNSPNTRQAVMQIWDPTDLGRNTKDKACNMQVVFRIRSGKLDMTVNNRSNDMIWGAYGANVVQFSMLQEYVAAHLDLPLGTYTQISNAFHVYTDGAGGAVWDRVSQDPELDKAIVMNPYHQVNELVFMDGGDIYNINQDIMQLFNLYDLSNDLDEVGDMQHWSSYYFNHLVMPMLSIYLIHRHHGPEMALKHCGSITSDDWRKAAVMWLTKRLEIRKAKEVKEQA